MTTNSVVPYPPVLLNPKSENVARSKSVVPYSSLSKDDAESCEKLLSTADMFLKVTPLHRKMLLNQMYKRVYGKNEVFMHQDDPTDRFCLIHSGEIRRSRIEDGKEHTVTYPISTRSIGSMRVLEGSPNYSTVKCGSDECKLFEMSRSDLLSTLRENPQLAIDIGKGLSQELRTGSRTFQTPLLEQKQAGNINYSAVAIAAGVESYYRSALNAILNARLTGGKMGDLLPNMHIQVPTRIAYITGLKGLRSYFESSVDPDLYKYPDGIRIVTAVAPGLIITPVSSILEASNAGHMNSENLWTRRWLRGLVPRCGREIIFGIGLNQMSDYFEERVSPFVNDNHMMATAVGSLFAGVVSGYLSHVPHNLSTLKLMQPQKSYGTLYKEFVNSSVPSNVDKMVQSWSSPTARSLTRGLFATICPRGVMIRTVQIVGSFIILNGSINIINSYN